MLKNKGLLIIGLLLGIVLLAGSGLFFWRQRRSVSVSVPLVTPPLTKDTAYEVYQTADGNFSFEYPSTWVRTEIEDLDEVLPKYFIDKYQLEMPAALSDPGGAQITLSIYYFTKGKNLDEIMDTLEAELVAMGQPYNETSRQMVGGSLVVDSTVEEEGGTVRVRDILFLVFGEDKDAVYNLSLSAPLASWGKYETTFSRIQNSAGLSR